MTLKYESEILFDLMKRDGDDTPSDVLPYESELKEKYLEQVEGAYPKLTDYRPEWLNYNLYQYLPADFPTESVANVTNATVDNVVPYAYGSASLKGMTLVNLLDRNNMRTEGLGYTFDNGVYTINTSKEWCKMIFTPSLVQNKKYLIMLSTSITDVLIFYRDSSNKATRICNAGDCPFIFTNPIDNLANVSIEFPTIVTNGTISHPMIIEYVDGMENWVISCFEGMQSVQMAGLTTTGKNLFDMNIMQTSKSENGWTYERTENLIHFTSDGTKAYQRYELDITEHLSNKINLGVPYYFNAILNKNIANDADSRCQLMITNKDGSLIYCHPARTFTLNKEFSKIQFRIIGHNKDEIDIPSDFTVKNIQLEEGSTATSYEPYQSNILTVNDDVTLRGIGGVKDELNLKTGELTQRIGEVVLDGSEKWNGTSKDFRVTIPNVKGYKDLKWGQKSVMCHLYPSFAGEETDCYIISEWDGNQIRIHDVNTTIEELKTKLSKNPLHVIFIANVESVKTLDLTVTDQNGKAESNIRPFEGTMHIMTNGTPIKPTATIEVPVEAITQNLMSFAHMKEEE